MSKRINLNTDMIENRELRLGSITSWDGSASELVELSKYSERAERNSQGHAGPKKNTKIPELEMPFSQQSMCANSIASCQVGNFRDCVLIQHSPVGCTARNPEFNLAFRAGYVRRGLEPRNINIVTTNLLENDMVFGASFKLTRIIRETYERYDPKAIFLSMSCSTGIIGEDITSVAQETSDELGIPVVPLYCEGFRSKHWSTGFDITQHGVVKYVANKHPKKQPDLINIVALWGTDYFSEMLEPLGLRTNYILDLADYHELHQITEAAATTTFCHTLGSYLSTALEQEYGIPQVNSPQPFGLKGTDAWLRAIAEIVGKQEEAERYIAEQHAKIQPKLDELRKYFQSRAVNGFLLTGSAYAHSMIAVLRDLGIEVTGSVVFHHDPVYDSGYENQNTLRELVEDYGDVPYFTVSKTRPFQLPILLKRADPDFIIIRHNGLAPDAARLGIPALPMGDEHFPAGYDGIIRLGECLKGILARKKYNQVLRRHTELPYSDWWLSQTDPFLLAHDPHALDDIVVDESEDTPQKQTGSDEDYLYGEGA